MPSCVSRPSAYQAMASISKGQTEAALALARLFRTKVGPAPARRGIHALRHERVCGVEDALDRVLKARPDWAEARAIRGAITLALANLVGATLLGLLAVAAGLTLGRLL